MLTASLPPKSPATIAESLSGLIERVTFFNEDTGFGVLKVKAKGHGDMVGQAIIPVEGTSDHRNRFSDGLSKLVFHGMQAHAHGFVCQPSGIVGESE